jgi:DNA invertase Pin-like site-specific DNA recombinase
MKDTVIYVRVSQADQNCDTQLVHLREYCQRMGYPIVKEYVDHGFSGKTDKRPAFEQLLQDMRDRKFNTLLVFKLDRVGRSLQHLLGFLQELRNRQVDFISLTENINTSTPHGELIWNILGSFAQYERQIIVARTMAGLARAKMEGKRLGRPMGSKDKAGKRRKSGYLLRWANSK